MPDALETALTGLTNWTVEFYVYLNSLPVSDALIFEFRVPTGSIIIAINTSGNLRFTSTTAPAANSATTYSTGTWHYTKVTYDGTTARGYFSPAASIDSVLDLSLVRSWNMPSTWIVNPSIGRSTQFGGELTTGYIDQVRISDSVQTGFPTVD